MFTIEAMTPADIAEALALWSVTPGICLHEGDDPESLRNYLERNPSCSYVARVAGELVGVALAGHDGRRGYLHHVAVKETHRGQGIGRAIVERCLGALREHGIRKSHLFVEAGNPAGKAFWEHLGWCERPDLILMSFKARPSCHH